MGYPTIGARGGQRETGGCLTIGARSGLRGTGGACTTKGAKKTLHFKTADGRFAMP